MALDALNDMPDQSRRRFFVVFQMLMWSFLPTARQNLPGKALRERMRGHVT
jgi:hypothetical protein